jgi:peptidoglycan/xylan/chitin deacetylase (PgdA/CDA1 family)
VETRELSTTGGVCLQSAEERSAPGPSVLRRALMLVVSAGFWGYLSLRGAFQRLLGRIPPATCIILYYHSVPAKDRKAFAKQVEMLARIARPVSVNDVSALEPGTRYAAVTFDDGFEDAIENAVPELVKRNVPAVFFVTTGVLGQPAAWWPETAPERHRRIATAERLQQLPSEWIGVGAHTLTHPRLSQLDEEQAKREILEPRGQLEALLGHKIETFSFPYGDFNDALVGWCRDSGYKRVFTTQHTNAFGHSGEFVVGRVKAEPTDWTLEFRLKLLGGYLWRPWASALKRRFFATPSYIAGFSDNSRERL